MSEQRENNYDAVVIGGGQAGLSMGFYLRRTGLSYVILDAQEKAAGGAYLSKKNLQTAIDNNAIPYIGWKSNSGVSDAPNSHLWNRLFHYYCLNQDKSPFRSVSISL